MDKKKDWNLELSEYIKQGKGLIERKNSKKMASGL